MNKKVIRLSENDILSIVKRILNEDAFEPSIPKKNEEKFKTKIIEKLEDAYMRRDWIIVREIISDLKYKLRKNSL